MYDISYVVYDILGTFVCYDIPLLIIGQIHATFVLYIYIYIVHYIRGERRVDNNILTPRYIVIVLCVRPRREISFASRRHNIDDGRSLKNKNKKRTDGRTFPEIHTSYTYGRWLFALINSPRVVRLETAETYS